MMHSVMSGPTRFRDAVRQQLRDAIIDAAREQTVAYGWEAVRMADVAAAAGVSRQTVYNEFANKAGLAEAVAQREIDRFVAAVREALYAHSDDVYAASYAAIARTLRAAADNPLIKAILTSARGGADELLPYLTTRADLVLDAATAVLVAWVQENVAGIDPAEAQFGAESIVRLVVSHIVLPSAPPERTAAALAALVVRTLIPRT
jgi:AcrR family transcriptional regulator